jgi:hypothetical protein
MATLGKLAHLEDIHFAMQQVRNEVSPCFVNARLESRISKFHRKNPEPTIEQWQKFSKEAMDAIDKELLAACRTEKLSGVSWPYSVFLIWR